MRKLHIGLIVVVLILVLNRYFYGVWNPLSEPEHIKVFGREYNISAKTVILTDVDKPQFTANSFNIITFKKIYINEPKGEFVPTVIYLPKGDNIYQPYALLGGP